MAQLVVASVLIEGRSKSEVVCTYGVSRRWVITLVQRYLAEGDAGLEPRSRRPRRSPNRIPAELEDEIVEIRKELTKGGYEAGAATIDDHSRLCPSSTARPVFKARHVDAAFRHAAATYGDPASVLSDNGAVFTGRYRRRGRVALEVTLNERGIVFTHSRPYHPQTCGKVERFHQTLKRWLATQPPAASIPELQAQLDRLRGYYNTVRPHRALGRRTPIDAYQARPKAVPTGTRLDDAGWRVRHDTVDAYGKLTFRHNSRLHHIGIGRRHATKPVLILAKAATSASPQRTARSSETSNSTPPGTTNPNPKRERCPETPVHGVSRHRTCASGGI